uniref:Bm773 n=2 Tax=Brugia malayi TaxID=6279 RepID=A0A1U7F2C7_BRUMA|nr:Bm773 [Brugia malayi]CDQ01428.1 Bm776 [Brugia malayi]CDQ01588.1 Bm931 [Brugia malayi]CDQ01610.1 Bm953 [Brugia malayi]CDQ01650.1 Bm990 [Brugia malayi]
MYTLDIYVYNDSAIIMYVKCSVVLLEVCYWNFIVL